MRSLAILPLLMLAGCISTAAKIITAPVRIVGAGINVGVDSATTTQKEADEDRGRAIRKQTEADAKAARNAEKARRKAQSDAIRRSD